VRATVKNVTATAHLDTGDFECTEVTDVVIDGPLTTFSIYRRETPFGGLLHGTTLHLGDISTRRELPPQPVEKGSGLTIVQPVGVADL
jgi:hypothetical protein